VGKNSVSIHSIEQELQEFTPVVIDEFRKAIPLVVREVSERELYAWGNEGVAIARCGSHGWKAAAEYFRVSPQALRSLEFWQFINWARWGKALAEESAGLSLAYFGESPSALKSLQTDQFEDWARLGKSLYGGTQRSTALAARYYHLGAGLFHFLTRDEVEQFVTFINYLARSSVELAGDCLSCAEEVLSRLEKPDFKSFLDLVFQLAGKEPNDAKTCFAMGPEILSRVEKGQRASFLLLAGNVGGQESRQALAFLTDGSKALGELPSSTHYRLLLLTKEVLALSCLAATEFLKSCPAVLSRVEFADLERWVWEGMRTFGNNEDGGVAYFRSELKKSTRFLEQLSAGVELSQVREVLTGYCRALAGKDVAVLSASNLREKGIGRLLWEGTSTEGAAVLLPELVERYPTKDENFTWYKVATTHQAGHYECDTFAFSFEKKAYLFGDLLSQLTRPVNRRGPGNELVRFLEIFDDYILAIDIFTIVEDTRVDCLLNRRYRGMGRDYGKTQEDAMSTRPALTSLPLREFCLEMLVRISLGSTEEFLAPPALHAPLRLASQVLRQVQSPRAAVEDSAGATIRLYRVLSQIPNRPASPDNWETIALGKGVGELPEPLNTEAVPLSDGVPTQEAGALPYTSPAPVAYRGDFKLELARLDTKLKAPQQPENEEESSPSSRQPPNELAENDGDAEINELFTSDLAASQGVSIANLTEASKITLPIGESQQKDTGSGDSQEGILEDDDLLSYFYDEWDFRANDYRLEWCRVRQKMMDEGHPDFFRTILEDHSGLVARIREEFERLNPQFFRKVKRLHDGHEFDMDAVVNFIVEKKAGQSPNEKVYWRRNKTERDVSVVILLDMSSSTIEYIDEKAGGADGVNFARDYKGYLEWIQYHQDYQRRPQAFKRIIDVEKESVVLLIEALESVGDTYALFGFSGSGRENVEFYIIKDLEERFSDRIKRRVDAITPLNGTRMGPAIRHATWKLEQHQAKSKFLFLISDGRPQDHGYGRDGLEKEYAINDTKMAFVEAMRKNITPFCLTVDRAGHDYLKTMCRDMGYEVLADIESLPERLPALYRKLTI